MNSVFETDRLAFTRLTETDENWIRALWANPKNMHFIPGGVRPRETSQESFQMNLNSNAVYVARSKDSRAPVGYIVLRNFDWTPKVEGIELGYIIDPAFAGQGLATEASLGAIKYAKEKLSCKNVWAVVHQDNTRSQNIMKKLGFTLRDDLKAKDRPDNVWHYNY